MSIDYFQHGVAPFAHNPPLYLNPAEWSTVTADVLMLYDSRVPIGGSRRAFADPFYTLWLLREGEVILEDRLGNIETVAAHNWILIPPDYEHSQTFSADARVLSIHFHVQWEAGLNLFSMSVPAVVQETLWSSIENSLQALLRTRITVEEPVEYPDFVSSRTALERFVGEWYAAMCRLGYEPRQQQRLDQRVARAITYLDGLPFQGRIPYEILTERAAVSRTHLDRLFLEQLGKTPRDYHNSRILKRVIKDLISSRKTITEICYDHGFKSAAHFTRWFEAAMRRSPTEYRAALKRDG